MGRTKINDGLTRHQRYYARNKEKHNAKSREYHYENRDTILEQQKKYNKQRSIADKHSPLVYLLVKENYVGTTENLKKRLSDHKVKDRDISDVKILGRFFERQDALELEKSYHEKGYKGKHKFNLYK